MVGLSKIHIIAYLLICLMSLVKADAINHSYVNGETVPIFANKVISSPYSNPREPYHYYDLPFCPPDGRNEKVKFDKMMNGSHLVLTPYKLEFLVNKQFEVLCKKTLRKTDVSMFRSLIEKDYRLQFYHDDLPIMAFIGWVKWDHTHQRSKDTYFLFTHYNLQILHCKDHVIEVIIEDSNYIVDVTHDKEVDVEFTYSVRWHLIEQLYDKRMDKYMVSSILPAYTNNTSLQSYSIANSCLTIFFLVIFIVIFYLQVLRKDIFKYAYDVEDAEVADNQEETGWKNIHGDVFRFPRHKSLFAAALGSGAQLLILIVAILIIGLMGVFPPYPQGVFLKPLAIVYAVTSVVSGYTSVSFYCQLEGTRWIKNLLLTGGIYFGPLFLTFGFNDTVAFFHGTITALPLNEIIMLSLLWMFLASPLLLLGGYIGKNKVSDFQAPCRTSKCPKDAPRLRWYRSLLPQIVLAGFLPFGVVFLQLFEIFYAIWGYGIYVFYSSLLIILFLLLITTALVSVIMTYFQLAAEDHEWWWRSFFCGGSTGLYVYGYSIYYYFYISSIYGTMHTSFFFGYMACLCYGIFLLLGTVGFHASLLFVRYLYTSIKCD